MTGETAALIIAKRGTEVSFNLVAKDDDDCVELAIYSSGLYTGDTFVTPNVSPKTFACSRAEADGGTCAYNMKMMPHERRNANDDLVTDGKLVRRKFQWPTATSDQDKDPRPGDVTVCFYAFDMYIVSRFRCVRILLTTDKIIYWMDQRPGLVSVTDDPADPQKSFFGSKIYSEQNFYDTFCASDSE